MKKELRTGAWYGDRVLELGFPENWDVVTHWPETPTPLREPEIRGAIERPVGQARVRELCRGKKNPVVVVDDLNRATPAEHILPHLLEEFRAAGIDPRAVTIVMATGTHGPPLPDGMARKVGREAAATCRLIVHDDLKPGVRVGTTSYGTAVIVDREVAAGDFLVGVGGIYPNFTAGYGGGAKLALGVLARRSIAQLHYRHSSAGWGVVGESSFRKDVGEAAELIGLRTQVAVQVDAHREIIRAVSGDPSRFYAEEVEFARRVFAAPAPGDADVVVMNTYPGDLSLTFVKIKGSTAAVLAKREASRILIGSASEGPGHHGLFPVLNVPRNYARQVRFRELDVLPPSEILRRAVRKAGRLGLRMLGRKREAPIPEPPPEIEWARGPLWVYRPGEHTTVVPSRVPTPAGELRVVTRWEEVLERVREEQLRERLRVAVYPCAPLQWVDTGKLTEWEVEVRATA